MSDHSPTLQPRQLSPAVTVPALLFTALLAVSTLVAFFSIPRLWMQGDIVLKYTYLACLALVVESLYLLLIERGRSVFSQLIAITGLILSALGLCFCGWELSPVRS